MNPKTIREDFDRLGQNTEVLYRRVLRGPDALQLEAEANLEGELLDAVSNSKFSKLTLGQIARSYGVSLELIESIAHEVTARHLGADLEQMEFTQVTQEIKQIEALQDPGVREWKLQSLARRLKRSPRQLMDAYNKCLLSQTPVVPLSVAEFKALNMNEVDWLISGWIARGTTLLLHADGGVGKTLFAYEIMEAILKGTPWNGYPVQQGKVLLVQVDEPSIVTNERLDIRQIDDGDPLAILSDWQVENMSRLESYISENRPDLLIIDSLTSVNRNCVFSENDTEYARPLLQLAEMCNQLKCTAIIVHHSNAEGHSRGSRAIHNSVSEVWGMGTDSLNSRVLRIEKTRLGRPPGRYRFEFNDEAFSFRFLGPDDGTDAENTSTQEERIRLFLSDDNHRGIRYTSMEVAELVSVGNGAVRRSLYELWARGLIQRKRPVGTRTYLYWAGMLRDVTGDQCDQKGGLTPDHIDNPCPATIVGASGESGESGEGFFAFCEKNPDHIDHLITSSSQLHNTPEIRPEIQIGKPVRKKGKNGWKGVIKSIDSDGFAYVQWVGDKTPTRQSIGELDLTGLKQD